jgi:hypothetical protein
MGLEGIVSKRKDSPYRSGRSPDWLKMKNPACAAVKREAEEDWGERDGDNQQERRGFAAECRRIQCYRWSRLRSTLTSISGPA